MAMQQLQKDVEKLTGSAKLSNAAQDVDKLIDLLTAARDKVAAANDPHTTSLTLTKLQNPIREGLDTLNNDLKRVHKAHNDFNKSLKVAFSAAKGSLPTDHDPMESQEALINRAIAMHLLREGHFGVASTFISETQTQQAELDPAAHQSPVLTSPPPADQPIPPDADVSGHLSTLHSQALQSSFSDMYSILNSLKAHDLHPAITWARTNCKELEARGSNLEFELCRLQFVWLFKGSAVNGLPDGPENGVHGALRYAKENFGRFQQRHIKEIRKLSCAIAYSPNLATSPYRHTFDISLAFEEVSASFTREFCSLLGLSAESPLYVAVTAGALSLPRFVKYINVKTAKKTEWTTDQELGFETPLPKSMMYHSIFVCPVSKEQTTEANPPMLLPACGHVLARESLHNVAKNQPRYKCPYCPVEGMVKDAKEIVF